MLPVQNLQYSAVGFVEIVTYFHEASQFFHGRDVQ